jgi:hypothetical protein
VLLEKRLMGQLIEGVAITAFGVVLGGIIAWLANGRARKDEAEARRLERLRGPR